MVQLPYCRPLGNNHLGHAVGSRASDRNPSCGHVCEACRFSRHSLLCNADAGGMPPFGSIRCKSQVADRREPTSRFGLESRLLGKFHTCRVIICKCSPHYRESRLRPNHNRGSGRFSWPYYGLHVEVSYARSGSFTAKSSEHCVKRISKLQSGPLAGADAGAALGAHKRRASARHLAP